MARKTKEATVEITEPNSGNVTNEVSRPKKVVTLPNGTRKEVY